MRKLLFLTGLVMAAVLIACSGNASANSSSPSTASGDGGKTTVTIDGKKVEVDTFTANHYENFEIQDALKREAYVCKKVKPTSASFFGRKLAEVVWRAIRPDRTENGTVTVVYYEKGIEIKKNEQSWFYDDFKFKERYLRTLSATESILHPGIWEPAYVEFNSRGLLVFTYAYTAGCPDEEYIPFFKYQSKKLGILEINNLIL